MWSRFLLLKTIRDGGPIALGRLLEIDQVWVPEIMAGPVPETLAGSP